LKYLRDVRVVHIFDYLALHHCASVVVLYVSSPSALRHVALNIEALLPKEARRIVIGVSQEVLESLFLSMVFEFVHKPCPQTAYLLRGSDSQEDNLCEPLCSEGSENAPTKDLRPLTILPTQDHHRFMLAIHSELDYVVSRHARELLCNDVL